MEQKLTKATKKSEKRFSRGNLVDEKVGKNQPVNNLRIQKSEKGMPKRLFSSGAVASRTSDICIVNARE